MKITDLDRRRAIKRFPEFKKDCARHKELKTDEISQFLYDFLKKWGYEFEAILRADEVAEYRKDTPTVEAVTRITDDPYSFTYTGEEKIPATLYGDKLYLKVNLKGKTQTQLGKDFKEAIKPYLSFLKTQISIEAKEERDRKTDMPEGIWPLYDLFLKTGKKMVETTRQRFNVSGTPSNYYENENNQKYFDDKYLKQVQTAINNAEAIMASVREEYNLKK